MSRVMRREMFFERMELTYIEVLHHSRNHNVSERFDILVHLDI